MSSQPSSNSEAKRHRNRRKHERSRIALFDVFRHAFEAKDATVGVSIDTNERDATTAELSPRSNARRLGVDEETLRRHVHDHVATLMNTVRLDSAVPLEDAPDVKASIVNYGFRDLSNLDRKQLTSFEVEQSITESLATFEPRLLSDKIKVTVSTMEGDAQQRISVLVTADLIADPADIPVEFVADVDVGAGKVILSPTRF